MTLNAELALAAARTRMLAEGVGDAERDELIEAWGQLLDDMDEARSEGAREVALVEYRAGVEKRLKRAGQR